MGSSFAVRLIAPGNMGPRKKPRSEAATADTMNWGTSHMMS